MNNTAAVSLLIILALLQVDSVVLAFENDHDVFEVLNKNKFVSGEFSQEQTFRGITRSIKSSGSFIIWRGNGIYWETDKPMYQATTFTGECILKWIDENNYESDRDGMYQMRRKMSKIVLAFFTADFVYLKKAFDLEWHFEKNNWSVLLTPEEPYTKKAIKHIKIGGRSHINMAMLEMVNGDITLIELTVIHEGDKPDMQSAKKIPVNEKGLCK